MKWAMLLAVALAGNAVHRVDEYLEAATILVSSNSVRLDLRLAPGIAVAGTVLDSIDSDRDGQLSAGEQESYAERVRNDLRLEVDGERISLGEVSHAYSGVEQLRDGTGEILLSFEGHLLPGADQRKLLFENRHRPQIAAYLANGLVPEDSAIHIMSQTRNYVQSVYQMSYQQSPGTTLWISFDALLKWMLAIGALTALVFNQVFAPRRSNQ